MFIWIFSMCSIPRVTLVGSCYEFECNFRHPESPRGQLEDCKWFLVSMWEFPCCWRLLVSTGDHCCIYMLHSWVSLLKEQSAVTTAVSSADLLIRQQQMSWHWQTCIHLRMFSSLFWLIAIIQLPLYRVHSLVLTILRMPLILAAKFYQKREGRLIICTDLLDSRVTLLCLVLVDGGRRKKVKVRNLWLSLFTSWWPNCGERRVVMTVGLGVARTLVLFHKDTSDSLLPSA